VGDSGEWRPGDGLEVAKKGWISFPSDRKVVEAERDALGGQDGMSGWLVRLDECLRELHPTAYSSLQPGLTDVELKHLDAWFGRELPSSIQALYRWRNGQTQASGGAIQHNMRLMPSHEIIRVIATLPEDVAPAPADWWRKEWLPFLQSPCGNLLCVDTAGAFGGRVGQLIYFDLHTELRTVEYPSVESWAECFAASLEKGLWVPSSDGNLTATKEFYDYRQRVLPGYPACHHAR
jgi:cell wall assembly regulator SMI1